MLSVSVTVGGATVSVAASGGSSASVVGEVSMSVAAFGGVGTVAVVADDDSVGSVVVNELQPLVALTKRATSQADGA